MNLTAQIISRAGKRLHELTDTTQAASVLAGIMGGK